MSQMKTELNFFLHIVPEQKDGNDLMEMYTHTTHAQKAGDEKTKNVTKRDKVHFGGLLHSLEERVHVLGHISQVIHKLQKIRIQGFDPGLVS